MRRYKMLSRSDTALVHYPENSYLSTVSRRIQGAKPLSPLSAQRGVVLLTLDVLMRLPDMSRYGYI